MHTLYCISGLGADERLFRHLLLHNVQLKYISWFIPEKDETFKNYVRKLCKQIDTTTPFSLLGVSLGGITAIEISKILNPDKVIIVSSVKTSDEMPLWLRWIGKFRFEKIFPAALIKEIGFLNKYLFGLKHNREKELFLRMLKDSNTDFLQWSFAQVTRWSNDEIPSNLTHIHGTNDRIFPVKRINNAVVVKGGSHFMIVIKAEEVSKIINKILE